MLGVLFLVALGLVAIVVVSSIRQGRRFIRAATFLTELEGGRPRHEANALASVLFTSESSPSADAHAAQAAERRRRQAGLSQARLIGEARQKGFEG
jgi:hypothetical protein